MVIYGDILLLLNWWIDYLLLLGVRRALFGGGAPWRMALGALVGALCSFVLFLPPLPFWLFLAVRLLSALGMVAVAFRWQGWIEMTRRVLLLFAFSAGLAGLCGALYFFLAPNGFYVYNGVVYYSVPPLLLVALTVVCYGLLEGARWLMRRRAPRSHLHRVRLSQGGHSVQITCLYDSGNHLTEPFSGWPVLVVERTTAERLVEVPPSVEALPAQSEVRWRLVPFDTVGNSGVLPAFVPKEAVVVTAQGEQSLMPCYVAVCDRLGRGEYRGLMGSAMGELLI